MFNWQAGLPRKSFDAAAIKGYRDITLEHNLQLWLRLFSVVYPLRGGGLPLKHCGNS